MILVREGYVTIILVTLTLLLQSVGMAVLIEWIKAQFPYGIRHWSFPLHCARGAIHKPACLLAHVGDSAMGIVLSLEMFCNLGSSFLFFAANDGTVGSGDLFLKQIWRTMGPVESVTGVLMCGLSASFLFAIVTRLVDHEHPRLANPQHRAPAYAGGEVSNQVSSKQPETVNS